MALTLRYHSPSPVPVEVEGIVPSVVREESLKRIEKLEVFHGNEKLPLGELFRVSGDPSDECMNFEGDLSGVHWIGAKMHGGSIRITGQAGRHVGSEMTAGNIAVEGDAGDWVGGELHGGTIHVRGRAGHLIGAAYRGSRRGMTGGSIFIDGSVGNEIGHTMRRGIVVVGGNAGDLAGFNMIAGTILVFGNVGIRHGAGMRRGTIGLLGDERPKLLPSFRRACRYRPNVTELVFRQLRHHGMQIPKKLESSEFDIYNGDLVTGGRGEIWVRG